MLPCACSGILSALPADEPGELDMGAVNSKLAAAAILTAGGLALSACATEEYVNQHVAAVNARIDQTNGRVDDAHNKIAQLGSRVDGVDRTAQGAMQRANAAGELAQRKADAKFVYRSVGGGISVKFPTAQWTLTSEAQSALQAFAERLKTANRNVYVEIFGHSDVRGGKDYNWGLAAKRALQVQRYLSSLGVPLNRMSVVSWGEDRAPDPRDRSARTLEQSRRVDLVLVN
jgi:peptidoglycan-associated lipoprotein